MKYPSHLLQLIDFFKKFPGVGQKSAERFAFSALDWPPTQLEAFGNILKSTPFQIQYCNQCGAMSGKDHCFYCDNPQRSVDQICIVASPKDIFSIEESHFYKGHYHVLGALLSPSSGFNSENLNLQSLIKKMEEGQVEEIIIALDSTVEGDATTLFLKKELSKYPAKISRLAFGIPVGSSLDYIDGSTLSRAFAGRQGF